MNKSELIRRYWDAWRIAIENYVAACDRNENGTLIHCLGKVVIVREAEFYRIQRGA
jgi:hypothetical protein